MDKMDIMNLISLILNILAMVIIGICYLKMKAIKKRNDDKGEDD